MSLRAFLRGAPPAGLRANAGVIETAFGLRPEHVLTPALPQRAEAQALLERYLGWPATDADLAAAWEAAASEGLIPADWVQHPTRRFIDRKATESPRLYAHPPSPEAFRVVVGNPEALAQAETLQAAYVDALAPWQAPNERSLPTQWWWANAGPWTTTSPAPFNVPGTAAREALHEADRWDLAPSTRKNVVARFLSVAQQGLIARNGMPTTFPTAWKGLKASLDQQLRWALGMHHAQKLDLRIGANLHPSARTLRDVPFRDLPNPHAAMLGLWRLGYGEGAGVHHPDLGRRYPTLLLPVWDEIRADSVGAPIAP